MSRIGFIGTGHIAAPMVRFLHARGHDITVTERGRETSSALRSSLGVTVADPQDVVNRSEIVFLCVRPNDAEPALIDLTFRADQRIVSVMASVSRAALEDLCAPAASFVQTIPLGFLEKGGCPLAAFGDTDLLAALFEPENPVVPVATEDALNAHFAICAMVPGVLDLLATGSHWLGSQSGDADAAEYYTTQLVAGFLAAMDKDHAGRLIAERDALATEGTLSLQMTEGLRGGGAHAVLLATLADIGTRLNSG